MLARPLVAVGGRIIEPPRGLLTMLAVPSMVPGICDVTVRRGVARELGRIEPEFRLHFEDQVFISRVYLEKVVYALPSYLAWYRRHPDSSTIRFQETTAVFDRSANAAMRSFYAWLRDYVRARGVGDPLLMELVDGNVASSVKLPATARRAAALLVTRVKKLLRLLDATTLYRGVLRWEHELSWRRAWRRYRRLSLRMSEQEARRAGVRRMDE
jgi:hypothetical protein